MRLAVKKRGDTTRIKKLERVSEGEIERLRFRRLRLAYAASSNMNLQLAIFK